MDIDDITHSETTQRNGKNGIILTMNNGEKWFHPFDGSKPFKVNN